MFNASRARKILDVKDVDINDLAKCNQVVTPGCIRALYGLPEEPEYPNGQPRPDNSLGIFEEGDFYLQEDLDLFYATFARNVPTGTNPIPASIDGGLDPNPATGYAGGESNLDFSLAIPLIYPQNTT